MRESTVANFVKREHTPAMRQPSIRNCLLRVYFLSGCKWHCNILSSPFRCAYLAFSQDPGDTEQTWIPHSQPINTSTEKEQRGQGIGAWSLLVCIEKRQEKQGLGGDRQWVHTDALYSHETCVDAKYGYVQTIAAFYTLY